MKFKPKPKAKSKPVPWQPLFDRVIARRIEVSDKTESGTLFIPEVAKEKALEGVVVSCGPGTGSYPMSVCDDGETLVGMPVAIGDHIVFGRYAGTEVEIEGEQLLILRVDEILLRKPSEARK